MQALWHFIDPEQKETASQFYNRWQQGAAFAIQSSGTTGLPQLFSFEHAQLRSAAQANNTALGLDAQTAALLCLPLNSVGGLMLLARSLVGNFNLFISTPSSRPLAHLDVSLNFVSMVPTQLQQSLTHDLTKLQSIAQILIGGGALSPEIIAACQQAKLNVWQSYGMTETLSFVALRQISPIETPFFEGLPGISFSQENDCLKIAYPALFKEAILTQDIVELINAQQFRWLGRADYAINSGGLKIIPELLESKLAPFCSQPYFIVGLPDVKWGQIVAIVFESNTLPDLTFLQQIDLSNAEKPKRFAVVAHFERTATNKIMRQSTFEKIHHEHWQSI